VIELPKADHVVVPLLCAIISKLPDVAVGSEAPEATVNCPDASKYRY
jgi:hypothetical protein